MCVLEKVTEYMKPKRGSRGRKRDCGREVNYGTKRSGSWSDPTHQWPCFVAEAALISARASPHVPDKEHKKPMEHPTPTSSSSSSSSTKMSCFVLHQTVQILFETQ